MSPRRYRLDLSVRYAPRVPRRLRIAVIGICRRSEIAEADVVRYLFEAAVLLVYWRKLRLGKIVGDPPLDAMLSVRTSKAVKRIVNEIHGRSRKALLYPDVLRRLFEAILPIAQKQGIGEVMKLREQAQKHLRGQT